MLLKLPRADLVLALSKIQSIVEKRNSMPILEHVKVEVKNGKIYMTTTDMDITATSSFSLESDVETSFTTLAQPLYDIARKLYNCDNIEFEVKNSDEGTIHIHAPNSSFSLPCLPADSFPSFEKIDNPKHLSLPVSALSFLLNKTKHAMSIGEVRYYLNGVYLHFIDKKLISVATDMHRLAKAEVEMEEPTDSIPNIIVPRKSVQEFSKILDGCNGDESAKIEILKHKIKLSMPGIEIVSKIIDASFPNYSGVFDNKSDNIAIVNTKELARAVDLVTIVSESKMKSVKIRFSHNELDISIDSQALKSGNQKISAECDISEGCSVLLNSKYLLDVLSVIDSDKTEISLPLRKDAPVVLSSHNDRDATYVLMPMQ